VLRVSCALDRARRAVVLAATCSLLIGCGRSEQQDASKDRPSRVTAQDITLVVTLGFSSGSWGYAVDGSVDPSGSGPTRLDLSFEVTGPGDGPPAKGRLFGDAGRLVLEADGGRRANVSAGAFAAYRVAPKPSDALLGELLGPALRPAAWHSNRGLIVGEVMASMQLVQGLTLLPDSQRELFGDAKVAAKDDRPDGLSRRLNVTVAGSKAKLELRYTARPTSNAIAPAPRAPGGLLRIPQRLRGMVPTVARVPPAGTPDSGVYPVDRENHYAGCFASFVERGQPRKLNQVATFCRCVYDSAKKRAGERRYNRASSEAKDRALGAATPKCLAGSGLG
jgi:hypothetical protein